MKYVCELCGTIYDEDLGDVTCGIPAGTPFAMVPQDYECSVCGSEKEAFAKLDGQVRTLFADGNQRVMGQYLKYPEEYRKSER